MVEQTAFRACEAGSEELKMFNSLRQALEQASEMTDEEFDIFEVRGYQSAETEAGTIYQVKIKVENGIVNTLHAKVLKPKSGDEPHILEIADDMQEK